jgi:hypothetical protein
VERLGGVDRVLADHGIDDEEDLMRVERLVDRLQLAHQFIVDVQPAGGVEDEDVGSGFARCSQGALADFDRDADGFAVFSALVRLSVELDRGIALGAVAHLVGDLSKLLDRSGALQVGGGDHDVLAALAQVCRELAAGGGLAGALQAAHHDDGGAGIDDHDVAFARRLRAAHQVDELSVDDADHLLAGLEGLGHLRPTASSTTSSQNFLTTSR